MSFRSKNEGGQPSGLVLCRNPTGNHTRTLPRIPNDQPNHHALQKKAKRGFKQKETKKAKRRGRTGGCRSDPKMKVASPRGWCSAGHPTGNRTRTLPRIPNDQPNHHALQKKAKRGFKQKETKKAKRRGRTGACRSDPKMKVASPRGWFSAGTRPETAPERYPLSVIPSLPFNFEFPLVPFCCSCRAGKGAPAERYPVAVSNDRHSPIFGCPLFPSLPSVQVFLSSLLLQLSSWEGGAG